MLKRCTGNEPHAEMSLHKLQAAVSSLERNRLAVRTGVFEGDALLLPINPEDTDEAEQARHILTQRLIELERVRSTADWLSGQPQLGWDMFERGYYEKPDASVPAATTMMLIEACLGLFRLMETRPAAVYQPGRILEWTPN